MQQTKASHSLGGKVNGEATMENSMEVPRNTKDRGIIWSCNPRPQLRCRENHHSEWHVHLHFQGSISQQPRLRIHQHVHWRKNEDYVVHLYTGMLLSHKTNRNNDIGSSLDIPRNFHTINTFQIERDILRYHVQVESISSDPWTNLQSRYRFTDWENQVMIIKGKKEERKKRKWCHSVVSDS